MTHPPIPQKILIVGGVAGGMSAAARLRRLNERAEIVIFERSGYVSFANCGLPYYLGGEITDRSALLLQTPQSLAKRFKLDVRVRHDVTAIDPEAKTVTVQNLDTGDTLTEAYDDLILSVGAKPLRPPLPGLDLPGLFTLRTVEDVDALDAWQATHDVKRVVVLGGGFIGLEVAEQFRHKGLAVTLIDANPQLLRPLDTEMAERVHTEVREQGITLLLNAPVKQVLPADAHTQAGEAAPKAGWVIAGDNPPIAADMVLVGLGVRPDVALAEKAGLSLGQRKGIAVDAHLQTSQPHIWAVGDAIEVTNPLSNEQTLISLGGPANRQGRMVANNIMGMHDTYDGTIGTAVLRVFELTVASTGLNEAQLQAMGLLHEAIHLHPANHASYYPGAEKLALKVLFNPQTGKLYGAQAVGKAGVDKRMDVLATAIKAGFTVRDLAELELCYAPPYGSAKDPINLAGMIGENILDGLLTQVQWHQVNGLDRSTHQLLDVRDDVEREAGTLPDSLHIPLNQLRSRLDELTKDKTLVAYCYSGQRSYFATRLLVQHGFKASNLAGAWATYPQSALKQPALV